MKLKVSFKIPLKKKKKTGYDVGVTSDLVLGRASTSLRLRFLLYGWD